MNISASDIKFIRSLQQKKYRKETGIFTVEGVKPVVELIESPLHVHSVYATERFASLPTDSVKITEKELKRISGLKTPNKVLAIAEIPKKSTPDWNQEIILFLDGIRDPGNLGTIIRTAKWFGITDIICSTDCVDAYDRKVVQSTMGALFHVSLHYEETEAIITSARENEFSICGTTMDGKSIYQSEPRTKTILVIGSESHGMSKDVLKACDVLLSIPNLEKDQKVESLNAGVATAIILSELTQKTSV